ncbi:MAG TPA: hypothetical protein DDZ88_27610 [Verrucomicrobiales bacterium]|nr:hypothetical protein [Verrucomicrobiales bacterium]
MNSNLPTGLRAVFAFLDEALPAEAREAFSTTEVKLEHLHYMCFDRSKQFAKDACFLIQHNFQLMRATDPLDSLLEEYRLYHESDSAPALTWAYSLHKRGKNPLDALTADYAFRWKAVLSWMTERQIQEAIDQNRFGDRQKWPMFGDRWLRYQTMGEIGIVVLRGDRLLCTKWELKMTPMDGSTHWRETWGKFEALGGVEAFLAGKFDWPLIYGPREEQVVEESAPQDGQ